MKRISEKKLEAFTVGTMGKRTLSKKELEDQKKKNEEEAAAHAFKEFVETFQDTPTPASKVWVKAGTYDAGSRREDNREKGKLYKPGSKVDNKSAADKAQEYAKMLVSDLKKDTIPVKKKSQEKKKSNLELFKEELRQIQEEREERHKYKHIAGQTAVQQPSSSTTPTTTAAAITTTTSTPSQASTASTASTKEASGGTAEARESGSFDNGDPNTTNLYLGNLNPKISEQQLMEIFGRYGPLASIKIMWPRSEEEKQRGRNCGFVAYMSRRDAERALRTLNGRYIMGYEMRLGWGKSVPIMSHPIFIPPTMMDLTVPPPASNLPFNAQPPENGELPAANLPTTNYKYLTTDEDKENMERILPKCVVKIFIPTEKSVLHVIHRMIEFVIREGPMFEALIMSREMDNSLFSFLFDNECPAHLYYRWKLFSLLQGDTPTEWNEKPFRMFKGGPIWQPPIANFFTQGMSDDLVVDPDAQDTQKGALSMAQRERLEDLIHHLTPERSRIGDAMIFCIEHGDAADEICELIADALSIATTLESRKIARLYLVSDILHNCTVKVANASFFRNSIERNLEDIFESLHAYFAAIDGRMKAEAFKSRVLKVLKAWHEWAVYSNEFLDKLKCIFLGIQFEEMKSTQNANMSAEEAGMPELAEGDPEEDIDGAPLSGDDKDDEDLDGVPLDGAALLKGALLRSMPDSMLKDTPRRKTLQYSPTIDDIDGMPLEDDIDGVPLVMDPNNKSNKNAGGAFIPSKWETVDPEQVEAQAITTSKWDTLDPPDPPKFYDSNSRSSSDDSSNNESSVQGYKESREKLREIELKIMKYQDELESGDREISAGSTIAKEVEHYRKKLLRKQMMSDSTTHGNRSPDSERRQRKRKKSSSPSTHVYDVSSSRRKKHSKSPGVTTTTASSSNNGRSSSGSNSSKLSKTSRHDSPHSWRSSSPGYGSSARSVKRENSSGAVDIYDNMSPNRHRSTSSSNSDKNKHRYKH